MKTALITTTINVPKVIALYRKLGPEVKFFVTGDMKSDSVPTRAYCRDILGFEFLDVVAQTTLNYKCSELIGWNTVRRRNIALLEALKWGADVIVTIDDDNIPTNPLYFADMLKYFWMPAETPSAWFNGLKASSPSGWFDAGQLMIPQTPHRGFPYDKKAQAFYESITDAKVGVVAGLCLGDPDIDAVTRIATAPIVHGVSELARAGVITDPKETWTVYNTQNTSFIRELAPAMFCAPGLGRMDDIIASLITQRVMRDRDLHVHFGAPFIHQQRNQHDLLKDLAEEIWGMTALTKIADGLNALDLSGSLTVAEQCHLIWSSEAMRKLCPFEACETALTFLDDVEGVM